MLYLVAEFIITLLKLRVWDPNRDTLHFLKHTFVDAAFEIIFEQVGMGTESSNPEFAP